MKRAQGAAYIAFAVTLLALVTFPAHGLDRPRRTPTALLSHVSQSVQVRYLMTHPSGAGGGADLGSVGQGLKTVRAGQRDDGSGARDVFNRDTTGLPQNEEAVTVCQKQPQYVLSGTNDYRGLLDPEENFTGWYFSKNGGEAVANEGLLPALPVEGGPDLPSGGDPVVQSDEGCTLFAADLNYPADDPFSGNNGIGLYRSTPKTLASCPQGRDPDHLTNPSCWPDRTLVATTHAVGGVGQFLDKPWFDVGESGEAGEVIWITYSDFAIDVNAPVGFTGAQVKAVRCDADLSDCTAPILISGNDQDIQWSDVTIAQDGSVLVTWADIEGELEQQAQTFIVKARIAQPGSTQFGPTHVVAVEKNPLPFGGKLHSNDFRTATYPKSIMPLVDGQREPYVVWDRCKYRVVDFVCEEPEIVMSHSPDGGTRWTKPVTISTGGDNYFPAISDEIGSPNFVVAWYTNRLDTFWHNQQSVEIVSINKASGKVDGRHAVTSLLNETEADPVLGGFFIGDYIDVHLLRGTAYVAYNANYRKIPLLGEGIPVPQQDNYLTRVDV